MTDSSGRRAAAANPMPLPKRLAAIVGAMAAAFGASLVARYLLEGEADFALATMVGLVMGAVATYATGRRGQD